ncbi:MAG: hypothetical protein LBS96_01735 [Oscillospiraceae bacterium]|nr:hypothetical protein [Oscillospiraceae bacterium]
MKRWFQRLGIATAHEPIKRRERWSFIFQSVPILLVWGLTFWLLGGRESAVYAYWLAWMSCTCGLIALALEKKTLDAEFRKRTYHVRKLRKPFVLFRLQIRAILVIATFVASEVVAILHPADLLNSLDVHSSLAVDSPTEQWHKMFAAIVIFVLFVSEILDLSLRLFGLRSVIRFDTQKGVIHE